jgi:signal transduction histidine kinase
MQVSAINLGREISIVQEFGEIDPEDLFVFADSQRLRQILINLLNNAVKYFFVHCAALCRTDLSMIEWFCI